MTVNEYFKREGIEKLGLCKERLQANIIDVRKRECESSRRYNIISEIETLNIIVFKK